MAESKSLKTAVKKEVKEAETGNVKTTKAPVDLPTNTRRHLPPE